MTSPDLQTGAQPVTLPAIAEAARREHLAVFGALHEGDQTVVLLGPAEPGFWAHVTAEPEFGDAGPDPLDRWSSRVIDVLAKQLGAKVRFPFGGPPWHPFIGWATRSGRAWPSPVTLLVHDEAGLMVSYRGALVFDARLDLPPLPSKPCDGCAAPCTTACPVNALTPEGYDVAACRTFVSSPNGDDCRQNGCAARRACPVSQRYGRLPAQSAHHMAHFAR